MQEDDEPDYYEQCPYEVEYIWAWFHELDQTRDTTAGLAPISHTEITNWSNGMNYFISPFERQALLAIDKAYRTQRSKSKE